MKAPGTSAEYRRLWAAMQVGWRTLDRLRTQAGSWRAVLQRNTTTYSSHVQAGIRAARALADPLPEWTSRGWVFVAPGDAAYPAPWMRLHAPPGGVLVHGDLRAHDASCIAIIGSRRATPYGLHVARVLAQRAVREGATVLAGLASGIDTAAHRAAIEAGGRTIAILPTSLDAIYPRTNRALAATIVASGGALVSEYAAQSIPRAQTFHARNRLVAGLASQLVVVEAGERSGTMGTVVHAMDIGVEIHAVPGPITSPLSAGTNRLIAEGATPVLTLEVPAATHAYDAHPVVQALLRNIHDLDGIVNDTGIPVPELLAQLTALELDGVLRRTDRGFALR